MVSSDTTYNLKQRMPRFSRKGAGTCRFPRRCGYIGYIQPVPVPRLQVSIKINYGFILTQYLVSCQLKHTIYIPFVSLIFLLRKIFLIFFKIFSSICPLPYLYLTDQLFRLVFRSLTTEEHTPSCIWVLVGGSLLTVCHPSGLNCTQCSQATRPGRAQETVMEGMCKLFMILLTDILLYFLYCAAPFSTV